MLRPESYVGVVAAAVEAIAHVADGNLAAPVEHCPGFDVGRLLEHTGGFCRVVEARVTRDEEWKPPSGTWQEAPPEEVAGDPIGWHRRWGAALLTGLQHAVPHDPVRTWAGSRTRYFWFRRAALELTIHRWDAEHAAGATSPMEAAVALDGLDEFLGEFNGRAAPRLGGQRETYQYVAEDVGAAYTVTTYADRFELNSRLDPDVVARADADVLYRFVWGRATPDDLRISGDGALLWRWHERVRL